MQKRRYFILLLAACMLISGCKEQEKLYHGLGDSLRKTVKNSMADARSLPETARRCACLPTCIIAMKQYITAQSFSKQLFDVGASVVSGAITALPISVAAKAALKTALTTANSARGLKFKGNFTQFVDWDQTRDMRINKTCTVDWYGFLNPNTMLVTVIFDCICADARCIVKYTYTVNKDGIMQGSASHEQLN